MAAAAVDVGYLSASYAVPESTLQSLLSEPTVELVQSLLVQIEARAREYDELQSEKLRSDVELENAVRSGDTRAKALKASADKALKEVEELRQKLSQEENARDQIETELQNLKSSATSSTSEVQALESRIKTLEAQNRDTLALHEAKSAAHDRLADDLSVQHQKFVALRKQLSELDERNQTLENAATGAKYREQNLQQEIESLKKSNDWFEGELSTRAQDNAKFRKEKNAQIAELQRVNADASQTIESLRRTEASQRKRLEELDQKVEQSLLKIQQLQDEATQNQQSFQAELENARRLADLHQQSANSARLRLQEVSAQMVQVNDNAAQEVGLLQAEIDSERTQREAAEGKIAELESQVEGLETMVSELRTSSQIPATPRRGFKDSFGTPGRAGSPGFLSPGASRGGMSTTQLYAEKVELQKEVRTLREDNEKCKTALNEMLEELETRQPEIDELRRENERLTTETGEISTLLEEAMADRETARKETRKYQGDYKGAVREREIQQQQLRDLSVQINMLLLQQQIQDQGEESLSVEEKTYLHQAVTNQIPDEALDDTTDTGRLISRRLVLFRNIGELQQQNAELLRTIREVADRYEGSEAQAQTNQIEKDRQELAQLRDKLAQYEDEIKSLHTRSQSLIKERDMFRRIVTNRGQLPVGSDAMALFGQSIDGGAPVTPPPGNMTHSVEQTPHSKELAAYDKLIKDMQAHMDALRQESATDYAAIKQQADRLAKENNQLQADNMRLNNAISFAQERYDLLQNRSNQLQSENDGIQKRCNTLQDLAAKQDIRTQQVAEDLVEAKSLADSLERENTNLKASRDIAKSAESRLQSENAALMEERGRLSKMITDLQNLRNEQELVESENRRRLQTRAESLESELQTVKRKLEEEVEDHKKVTLRYELDVSQARAKSDDLARVISSIRPELASVKTERDHLQARVDELKTELRIAEDRTQNLQPRPTPRVNGAIEHDDGLSREEELSVEISNLKRELEAAQEEIESANTDIETYKRIAKDAEDQLESQVDAQEQYQQEMDRIIAEKDAKIQDLEQRVEEISSELATTNTQLSELRRTHEEESVRFVQLKEQLGLDITHLKDEADRYKETAALHQEDLKAQADIATRAQQNYENELMKHSDAMKNLQREREQHNELKTEVAQYRAQAEAARASLAQGEEHWAETREHYERELAEGRTRFHDLNEQNKILHQQLENVSTQIAGLKQSRVSVAGGDAETIDSDANPSRLQEVINYLRREKDILDVQYELVIQENKRQKQQLDHLQTQLDQTREKLSAEQQSQSQNKESARSLEAYEKTVEQLNTFRESNSTLRNEARQAQARLEEKKKEVEDLYNQIQPLQARAQELENDLALKNGSLEQAERDREHWQKRYQDVLQNYNRIDPAELESFKTQIETLQTERDEAQQQINTFEDRLAAEKKAAVDETEAGFQERRQTMINQFKDRSRELSGKLKEKDSTIQSLTKERDELQELVLTVQQQIKNIVAERDEAFANANANADADTNVSNNNADVNADTEMGEEGQIDETDGGFPNEERQALEERAIAAERKAIEESNRAVALHIEVQSLQSRIRELENQAGELQQRIASLNGELSQAQDQDVQQRINDLNTELSKTQDQARQAENRVQELELQLSSAAPATTGEASEDLEKLKEELAAAQKEVEDLRTSADIADSSVNTAGEDVAKSVSEQVAQQVATIRADLDAQHEERMNATQQAQQNAQEAEEKANRRTETMKTKLNEMLKKKREESEEAIKALKSEHETTIERLNSEHQAEMAQVRQQSQASAGMSVPPEPSSETTAEPSTADTKPAVKVEANGVADLTADQIRILLTQNPTAQSIFKRNVNNQIAAEKAKLKEQHDKTIEELKSGANLGSEGASDEKINKLVEEAKAKVRDEQEKKFAAKMSVTTNRAAKFKAQVDVVEKAAQETPEKPVGEVWETAKTAKPAPAVQPPKPAPPAQASQLTQAQTSQTPQGPQSAQSVQSQPDSRPVFQPLAASGLPQPNGATANQNPFGQASFGQPSFGQSGQPMPAGTFGRPSNANQNQGSQAFQQFGQGMGRGQGFGGPSGIAQPGFVGQNQAQQQNQANTSRPNSPFTQQPQQQPQQNQQPQQGGRGRGQDNVGTGPAVLRNLVGQGQGPGQQSNQSSIPRGGGIPRPAGRGQPNQQNQTSAQGASGSQIGRGGGRGGRGGARGGGSIQTNIPAGQGQGQNSPRGLNPNAPGFNPGGGRGQKRVREDGGDGEGHQGGKRPRGGGGGGQ